VEEIVSSGTDRIIVYEGAEEKLKQLSSGLLEKLGVGGSSWDERESNGYSANLVPVENQLLSGSESEQQNTLVEEYEEDDYEDNYEDDYEDELEYVEINGSAEEINNRKKLYMDNDDSDQIENQNSVNQIDEKNKIDFKQKKQATTNLVSKRPIQKATETLDIEPLDEKNLVQDNKKSEKFKIDDPW
ncbi:photosystem reaction center subunit H, partial [Prochlorococcus sp. AH-736-P10]|nr:photosystem reaction center subunit H [Prochlorococcus sp. AH-736-P10]